ncbi:MAG: OB-fold nucleic acid binding domain-containing protein [Candidatus Woesearchaeota archaeon]
MAIKRQTAYRFWIRDIVESELKLNKEGYKYFDVKGKEAVRVNLIANVINKYSNDAGTYVSVTLDDGSAQLRVKTWNEDSKFLEDIEIGNMVLVVGRLSESNGEVFLRPEIVKAVENAEWELARKLELLKKYGKPERTQQALEEDKGEEVKEDIVEEVVVENKGAGNSRGKVINVLEDAPAGGIEMHEAIKKSGLDEDEADKIIDELLKEGEVYQPKRGFLKLID